MLKATWLTWKMHRFEVLFVVCVTAVLAISAVVVARHLADLGLAGCAARNADGDLLVPGCNAQWTRFWDINGSEGKLARASLVLFGPIAGLVLGVPVVARELELRTTALAWSLQGIRWRWLLARLLPMLLVAVIGLAVLGIAGSILYDALREGRQTGELAEVGAHGAALVARGFLAVGVALLTGALLGRTMPAFIIAAVVLVAWFGLGVGVVQSELSRQWAVWEPADDDSRYYSGADAPLPPLAYVDSGQFDISKSGIEGRPGAEFDFDALDAQVVTACGTYPDDPTDPDEESTSPEERAWADCSTPLYELSTASRWAKVVPASRYGDFVAADTLLSLLLGGAAILVAFPIVARRRPA